MVGFFPSKKLPVWLNYLLAVKPSPTQMTMWHCIKILPEQLQFDCGKHQRQRSCSSVKPSVSKSYDFFLDLKFCTNIIRGRIFLLSTSVRLAAGVSSLVTKFGGKHQKDKKKKKEAENNLLALFRPYFAPPAVWQPSKADKCFNSTSCVIFSSKEMWI